VPSLHPPARSAHRLPTRMQSSAPLKPYAARAVPALRLRCIAFAIALGCACVPAMAAGLLDSEQARSVHIEAGPLGRALSMLAVQTGLALSFDPALTDGRSAPALNGNYTPREAFARLLDGSGLELAPRDDASATLRKRAAPAASSVEAKRTAANEHGEHVLQAVTVRGTALDDTGSAYAAKRSSVGILGDKSLKDTPYTIEVYTRELLDNRQARSLADATRGDAAISLSWGDQITENNGVAIRGISPDFYTGQRIDGMTMRVRATDLPLEHFESVEILKGAGGFLYGFGAPGGVVNYVLKRAPDESLRRAAVQTTDSGLTLVHADLGGRFGRSDRFGYRVNAVHEEGDTYVDGATARRSSASVALDWRIAPDLVWRVDALQAEHVRRGGYWALVPNADGTANDWDAAEPLAPIDGSRRLAPSFARYASAHETYGTDLDWHWTPDWKLTLAYRLASNDREFLAPAIFADAQGAYSMRVYNYANRFDSHNAQAQVAGRWQTGSVAHELVVGTSSTTTRSRRSAIESAILNGGNLSDPLDFALPFSHINTADEANIEYDVVKRDEVFASDTLHLGADLDLILGVRHGTLKDPYANYESSRNTPTIAAVMRPWSGVSVYASYIEALEEGATAPDTAVNAGQVFGPLVSKQHEVGLKTEGRDWVANAALFRLTRGLSYTTAANVYTQNGQARYQGLELSGKARLSSRWLGTASLMWLDAKGRETGDATLDGKRIQGVAREQAAAYAEYRVPGLPLTVSAGARYVGKQPLDAYNRWQIAAVTLLDAGLRWNTALNDKPVVVRLNIDNLTDRAYWATVVESSELMQGAPRTIKLGAQIDF
jgi:iron complex outermembrane recepter protein